MPGTIDTQKLKDRKYMLMTRRLSNNFSGVSQSKMIGIGKYLPHQKSSDLARVSSSLKLTGDLPVLDGATDIFLSATPSEDQKQYAKEQGVELVYVPIGLEAFVFFVNEKNPVDDLTVEQIRGIYGGEYTNWSQLGGADRIINPVTRVSGSGSQTAMDKFMGDRKIATKSPFTIMGASIGFSYRYYMEGIVGDEAVKKLSLNGVSPSAENIQTGTYPIIGNFYAVHRSDNQNNNIPVLIDWILSDKGQQMIEQTGYVKLGR